MIVHRICRAWMASSLTAAVHSSGPVSVGEQLMLAVQDSAGRPAQSSDEVKAAFLKNAREVAKRGAAFTPTCGERSVDQSTSGCL